MRLYADNSKCSGCNACRVACSLNLFGESNPKKAALIIEPHFPAPGVYEVKVCTQCGDCAAVCPTDASSRTRRAPIMWCRKTASCAKPACPNARKA